MVNGWLSLVHDLFKAIHHKHLQIVSGYLPSIDCVVSRANAEQDLARFRNRYSDVTRLLFCHALDLSYVKLVLQERECLLTGSCHQTPQCQSVKHIAEQQRQKHKQCHENADVDPTPRRHKLPDGSRGG